MTMNLKKQLYQNGIISYQLELPCELLRSLENKDWVKLDQQITTLLEAPNGILYKELIKFHSFKNTEHIIAIRNEVGDEDGIWHDDGSRHIAFTWSLNESPELITGGELLFRKRGNQDQLTITPPPLGTLIIFLTGEYFFEHKVCKVTKGERKTIAGWCS